MKRAPQIQHKLQFALSLQRELMDDVCGAQFHDRDVPFLEERVGQLLATCCECFDYAAKDLFESLVLPLPSDPKLKTRYARGKLKVYFPFHRRQLLQADQPLAALRVARWNVFSVLWGFVTGIENNSVLPSTLIRHRTFAEAHEMVNQKKHDRLIVSREVPRATTIITGSGTAIGARPIGSASPSGFDLAPEMVGGPDVQIKYTKDFFFETNSERVGAFCTYLVNGTNVFLNRLYVVAFGIDPTYFDPWKTENSQAK